MSASAPVLASTARAFSGESMSPLATTGIDTSSLTAAIVSYSALPVKPQARVRPWTAEQPDPGGLRDPGHAHRVALLRVPAGADLERDGDLHRTDHRIEDAADQLLVAQQGGTGQHVAHLLGRDSPC